MRKQFSSLFDIVGPVMIGPSSSHTAGAARIGALARRILGEEVAKAHIILYESLALTGRGHGTDLALLGGLLGLASHDPELVEAAQRASAAGLTVSWQLEQRSPTGHPNTVYLELWGRSSEVSTHILAESRGGGKVRVVSIDGFPVDMAGVHPTLLVYHHDRAGAVAQVGAKLAQGDINIAFMELARTERGKDALMVMELDQEPTVEILAEIAGLSVVTKIRFCPPEGEANL